MSPDRKIRHEFFDGPPLKDLKSDENSWFFKFGLNAVSPIFSHPDVTFSRLLVANMLTEAWNEERFFKENGHMIPKPDEVDRMLQITWLQRIASVSGLLNGEEIRLIQATEGKIPTILFMQEVPNLHEFKDTANLTQEWKENGETIGCFQGSFDPPTVVHLECATESYLGCDRLLIGFDNDELLRSRKGKDRPRFELEGRRKKFGSFWMVDDTFVLRASRVEDTSQYAQDYRDLGIDIVFLSKNAVDLAQRLKNIHAVGAKPVFIEHWEEEFSATKMLELARVWGFID